MSDNPFETPKTSSVKQTTVIGLRGGDLDDLRRVAIYQKTVMACLWIASIALIAEIFLQYFNESSGFHELLLIGGYCIVFAACFFVFCIAFKIGGIGWGIILGIFTLVPIFGLAVMAIVNTWASYVMQTNGISVGLLGANMAQIDALQNGDG